MGVDKKSLQKIMTLVQGKVFHTRVAKNFVISLDATKMVLAKHLFNADDDALVECLKGEKNYHVMDKFILLCSPNIQNLITSFKHNLGIGGYMDNALLLKSKSPYDLIQNSCFLLKSFLLKFFS
jgi:hypothetical protein